MKNKKLSVKNIVIEFITIMCVLYMFMFGAGIDSINSIGPYIGFLVSFAWILLFSIANASDWD